MGTKLDCICWTVYLACPVDFRIEALLWGKGKEEVATGYRVARYSISDVQSLKYLESIRIDWHIIR
jgi:Rapamycin-insensitive companion of mTOR, N-term